MGGLNLERNKMQVEKECGCYVEVETCDDGTFYPITYCAAHAGNELRISRLEMQLLERDQIIRDLVVDTICRVDHEGFCQSHNWLTSESDCPVKRWTERDKCREGSCPDCGHLWQYHSLDNGRCVGSIMHRCICTIPAPHGTPSGVAETGRRGGLDA